MSIGTDDVIMTQKKDFVQIICSRYIPRIFFSDFPVEWQSFLISTQLSQKKERRRSENFLGSFQNTSQSAPARNALKTKGGSS